MFFFGGGLLFFVLFWGEGVLMFWFGNEIIITNYFAYWRVVALLGRCWTNRLTTSPSCDIHVILFRCHEYKWLFYCCGRLADQSHQGGGKQLDYPCWYVPYLIWKKWYDSPRLSASEISLNYDHDYKKDNTIQRTLINRDFDYRQVSNIRRTKFQKLKDSRPDVKSIVKM